METEIQSENPCSSSVLKLETEKTESTNVFKKSVCNAETDELLKSNVEPCKTLDDDVSTQCVLKCANEKDNLCTETSDVCQVTENNCRGKSLPTEKIDPCEISVLKSKSEVSSVNTGSNVESEFYCDSDTVEAPLLQHKRKEIVPSNSTDSRKADVDLLCNTEKTIISLTDSEKAKQKLDEVLGVENSETEKGNEGEACGSALQMPLVNSLTTAFVFKNNIEFDDHSVGLKNKNTEVNDLKLKNYSDNTTNKSNTAEIAELSVEEKPVSNLLNNENNLNFVNSDPKFEITLGDLIKCSDHDVISTVVPDDSFVSEHLGKDISGSYSISTVSCNDPKLGVEYLKDDSVDEYSSKETTVNIVDQLCSASVAELSKPRTESKVSIVSLEDRVTTEDPVLSIDAVGSSLSPSNTKDSMMEECISVHSTLGGIQIERDATSSCKINKNEIGKGFDELEENLVSTVSASELEVTTAGKTEVSVKPEVSSLKQSVFRVFRDVAKSVNKEQVNETLNENIKQVYRNVWKNVASENFPGQSFMNKFQSDGLSLKKSLSKEKLALPELVQKNSNVCESSETLLSSRLAASCCNDLKFKSGTSSEVSPTSSINSDSTQCGSQLSLAAMVEKSEEGQHKISVDAIQNETLTTSLSQYMYRASLSDLRVNASPVGTGTDILTREYQSDLNVNQVQDCSETRMLSSFGSNEHNSNSLLFYKSLDIGKTVAGEGVLGASEALQNSTPINSESEKQTSIERNSLGKNLIEDLQAATSQTFNIAEDILSSLMVLGESSDHPQDEDVIETEAGANGPKMSANKFQLQKLREKQLKVQDICKSLTSEVERLEAAASPQLFQNQLAALQEELQKCQNEAVKQKQDLQEQQQLQLEQQLSARTALTDKLTRLTKLYNEANANKEAMVVKYAVSEKNVLVAQKQRDAAERRCRDLEKDKEVLLARVKNISAEKTRITSILDKKMSECSAAVRDVERLKEDVNARDVKIKWTQAKLTAEMDALKAVQARLDAAEAQISSVKQEAADTVQEARMDETSRANVLDKEVTEHKSRLIVEENCARQLREELAAAKSKIAILSPQNTSLLAQVTTLKQQLETASGEREESETLFKSLQQQLHAAQQHSTALQHALDQLPFVRQQLQEATSELDEQKEALRSSEQRCAEHSTELELLRSKEAELLSFTQLLSETNSRVQSQLNTLTEAERQWGEEKEKLEADVQHWRHACGDIKQQLTAELTETRTRLETVCSELGQQTAATQRLLQRVAELEGDLTLERKRHANLVKDLNREVQKLRRKADGDAAADRDSKRPDANGLTLLQNGTGQNGSTSATTASVSGASRLRVETRELGASDRSKPVSASNTSSNASQDNLSLNSRASSQTSLNESSSATAGAASNSQQTILVPDMRASNELLVQRIVKLQKSLARRTEKEEFYEEHVAQLVAELQKKNRIIDYFVMKEEVGTMPDNRADAAKLSKKEKAVQLHKARMMQQKGIMSSIYGSQQKDDAMTLELSLEINRKLQALFEDTLLKNITLKESLSTLGDEVARLSLHSSRRQ
ncbi:hypothetical protein FHG87_018108 [Trinorchestia longiramus]|nr:hypothetical protein FHG87_018108 [Trinorchestia longiramus]